MDKMKRHLLMMAVLIPAVFIVSCEKNMMDRGVYISDDTVYFTAASGDKKLTVFNAEGMELSISNESEDWFSAGCADSYITISVSENASGEERRGILTFLCGTAEFTVEICQFGIASDFSSLPEELRVGCVSSRLAIGYVNTLLELSYSCDVDWMDVSVNDEFIVFAEFETNTTGIERTGTITLTDGVNGASVHVTQDGEGTPEVSYSYICTPDELEYTLSIDVEYVDNASDYRLLVLNPSGFSRSDEELYERLVTGGNEDYVFSNDNESSDGYITFYGFDIDQEFQVCIVAVGQSGEYGELLRQTHVIKDTEAGDGIEDYRSWIGKWHVSGADGIHGWDITIDRAVINKVLYMQGWDDIYGDFRIPVYFDEETGGLVFKSAFISYATSGGRPCDVYFLALYNMTTAVDMKIATDVGMVIAKADLGNGNSVSIYPEPVEVDGTLIMPESLGYVMQFYSGYETVSQFWEIPKFPLSLVRTGNMPDAKRKTSSLICGEKNIKEYSVIKSIKY